MAIYIHCPHCNERLEVMGQECMHCGMSLPPGVVYALSVSLGLTPLPTPGAAVGQVPMHVSPAGASPTPTLLPERQTTPTHHSALRPWLAALLSVICGLGQLYNGQILKGGVLLLSGLVIVLTWHFVPVQVLAPVLGLYAMADAYLVARRVLPPAYQRRAGG
jgi:TM2 domain-containing membrane protein YozV